MLMQNAKPVHSSGIIIGSDHNIILDVLTQQQQGNIEIETVANMSDDENAYDSDGKHEGTEVKKTKKNKTISPHINDIVSGRGSGSNRHEGNLYFRKLIKSNKELYLSRPKNEKMLVARDIYHTIESLKPPGRFLQKNPETGSWFEIGKDRALEKISQALREKNTKQHLPSQTGHFNISIPSQLQQDRFNMPQQSFGSGINQMASHVNQGYGIGASGPTMSAFDMVNNDLIPPRSRSQHSYVSDNAMFERRIAELRAAREQMMRGGGGGGPTDLIHQAQYQNSLMNSIDRGRNNFDLRQLDPSLESTFRSTVGMANRQSQWFQDSQSLEIPQNSFVNTNNRFFDNNANIGLSLFESERSRVSRQSEYFNSLPSQGLPSTQGLPPSQRLSSQGGLTAMMGHAYSDLGNNYSPSQLRNNQVPFVTPEQQQLQLNNFIMLRQQAAARGYSERESTTGTAENRLEEKFLSTGKRKRKNNNDSIQSAKERLSPSKRGKTSKPDVPVTVRCNSASSNEQSPSDHKESSLSNEAESDNKEKFDVKGDAPKFPPLKPSLIDQEHETKDGQSNSDEAGLRESSPSAGLDALSKAASLVKR